MDKKPAFNFGQKVLIQHGPYSGKIITINIIKFKYGIFLYGNDLHADFYGELEIGSITQER